jgi:hypothetical protein
MIAGAAFRIRAGALVASAAIGLSVVAAVAINAASADATAKTTAASPAPGWVVSVGDSYISGEAGRWAGNTHESDYGAIDALGPTAYDDAGTTESIPGCHRSKAAEIGIGGGVQSMNLACSGAKTTTSPYTGGTFTPGLDFYTDGKGHDGQALALQNFASTHHVSMVMVSIGGNNFNFASIVQSCVEDFLLSPSFWKDYCNDDSSVTSNFTSSAIATHTSEITQALLNIHTAMTRAGYADSSYSIGAQTYPTALPTSSDIRYSQSGYTRQTTGGCGFWNADLNWANTTAEPTINAAVVNAAGRTGLSNMKVLDVSSLFNGHELCQTGVGKLYEEGLSSWKAPGAVDKSEWVENIRTLSAAGSPFFVQESLHPNYWGELALRNCVRQVYNGGVVHGGTCTAKSDGLDAAGEPNVSMKATA